MKKRRSSTREVARKPMASTLATVAVRAFAGDAAPSAVRQPARPYVNVPFSGHADAIPMAPGSIEAELLSKYGGGQSSSAPLASSSSPSSPYVDPLSRVMPTIFVAGPAKSGSTFLWDCLQASFHPETQCGGARRAAGWGDGACGQPFVLPSLVGEIQRPGCLRFEKESAFWRYWGRRKSYTWQRYGGPVVPLERWERQAASCSGRRARRASRRGGPRALEAYAEMEDLCMGGVACPALAPDGGPLPYATALPAACRATCAPCAHHPGWMNNADAPCPLAPHACDSPTCAAAPFVPKAARRLNYSTHHARAFSLSAFASWSALAAANVSLGRVRSLEGNPGLFQTPTRHARAVAALTRPAGRPSLRFVVGLRGAYELGFSLWSFLASIGQEGKRVEVRFGRALAALTECNASLAAAPHALLGLPPAEVAAYRGCLDERPRAKQHFYLYGGLYALHLLGWFAQGFAPSQFLLVRMSSLPRAPAQARALQEALASFVGLPPPADSAATARLCLGSSMVTRKQHRVKMHNGSTVAQVKAEFGASAAAADARRFLGAHDAVLDALVRREGMRVY